MQHSSDQKLVVVETDGRIARRNTERTRDDQRPSVLPRSQYWHRIRKYLPIYAFYNIDLVDISLVIIHTLNKPIRVCIYSAKRSQSGRTRAPGTV